MVPDSESIQLASLRYSKTGAPDLLNLTYDYNQVVNNQTINNGQIQKVHFYTAPGTEDLTKSENFTYDAWGRLRTAGTGDGTSWGIREDYDRFGNRLEQHVTAGSAPNPLVTVDVNTNRINSSGYAYDAAGNMTNDTNHTYAYDAGNWLTQVDGGTTASYTYLGALRVKKTAGTTTTVYVYSGTKPIAEYVGGALSKEYVYANGLVATVKADGTVTYQHPDQLSIRAESDASGCVLRRFGHFPFGESWYEALSPTQSDPCTGSSSKWQFTSYERDSESGLDYAQYRFDSSRLGRFMSGDPLSGDTSNPQSLNRYSYVGNDVVNRTDPTGALWGAEALCLLDDKGDNTGNCARLGGGAPAGSGDDLSKYACAAVQRTTTNPGSSNPCVVGCPLFLLFTCGNNAVSVIYRSRQFYENPIPFSFDVGVNPCPVDSNGQTLPGCPSPTAEQIEEGKLSRIAGTPSACDTLTWVLTGREPPACKEGPLTSRPSLPPPRGVFVPQPPPRKP